VVNKRNVDIVKNDSAGIRKCVPFPVGQNFSFFMSEYPVILHELIMKDIKILKGKLYYQRSRRHKILSRKNRTLFRAGI
jgi:hypothetical protein